VIFYLKAGTKIYAGGSDELERIAVSAEATAVNRLLLRLSLLRNHLAGHLPYLIR
jgi:hypothetical protein